MNVISLKDYAAQNNISYEAVRQQVVRYKDDLAGHVIRDGRQQLLDEEAVAFLDSKRQKNPVAIIQMDKDEQIEALEEQVNQLLVKTAAQADRISELAEWKADNALLIAGAEQSRLALQAAQAENDVLRRDYDQTAEALDQARAEAAQHRQKAVEAADRAKATQDALDVERGENAALRAKIDALESRTFLQRLFNLK